MLPTNEISEGFCLHPALLSSISAVAAGLALPSASPATRHLPAACGGKVLWNLLWKLKFSIKGAASLFEVGAKSRLETWQFGWEQTPEVGCPSPLWAKRIPGSRGSLPSDGTHVPAVPYGTEGPPPVLLCQVLSEQGRA